MSGYQKNALTLVAFFAPTMNNHDKDMLLWIQQQGD
jgi:hypothetical protein